METFPSHLGCWLKRGFGNTAPQQKMYLGGSIYDDRRGTINAVFVLKNKADALILLDWWSVNINGGTDEFEVSLPFFREGGVNEVYMENDLSINMEGSNYVAVFNLRITSSINTILSIEPPVRVMDLKALFNMSTAEVHLTWSDALFATSYDLYYNGFKLQTGITSPFVTPYVGTGDYTIEAINAYGSSISNTATIRLSTFAFYYSGATAQYTNFQWIMPNLSQYQSPINAIMRGSNAIAINEGLDTNQYAYIKTGASLTRASVGSYIEQGYVKYAEIDEARFEDGFGLVEDEMLNYIKWSDTLDPAQTFWTESRCVLTINDAIAPDGNMTASKMTASPNTAQNYYMRSANSPYPTSVPDNTICTESVFVKKGTTRYCGISVVPRRGTQDTVYYDFDTNTFTFQSAFVLGYEARLLADGWVRISITFDLGVVGTSTYDGQMRVFLSIFPNTSKFDADGTETMYLWGGQTEVGDKMTSYRTAITTASFRASDIVDSSDCYMIRMNTNENRHEIIGNTVNGGSSKEYLSNGDFYNSTDWLPNDGWSIDTENGVANCDGSQTVFSNLFQSVDPEIGKTFRSKTNILEMTDGNLRINLGGDTTNGYLSVGERIDILVAENTNGFALRANPDLVASIESASITEVIENSTSYRQTDSFSNMVALDILPTQGDLNILDNNPNALFETWMGVDHGLSFTALNIKHLYLGNEGTQGGLFANDIATAEEQLLATTIILGGVRADAVDNGDGTWTFTCNDDTSTSYGYLRLSATGGSPDLNRDLEKGELVKFLIKWKGSTTGTNVGVTSVNIAPAFEDFAEVPDIWQTSYGGGVFVGTNASYLGFRLEPIIGNSITVDMNETFISIPEGSLLFNNSVNTRELFKNNSIGISNFLIEQDASGKAIAIGAENDLIGAKDGRFIDVGGAEYLVTDCISGLYGDINTDATLIPCE